MERSAMTEPIQEMALALQRILLPSLTRPDLGPSDPPTLELVQFDLKAYAYSSIAYVRDLLNGLLVLVAAHNVAAVDLVIRGLFEWTMQASYVDHRNRIPMKSANFVECRTIMDRIRTGNGWLRKHGEKYWDAPFEEEIPDSLRIRHLVEAYKAYQLESRNRENVEDDYGYLSEHAHPNSVCFLDVTQRSGRVLEFVQPTPGRRNRGIVTTTMLDWSLCIYSILGLAGERVVRKELVTMLEKIVKTNEKSQGG
jgi:hypothetical protein